MSGPLPDPLAETLRHLWPNPRDRAPVERAWRRELAQLPDRFASDLLPEWAPEALRLAVAARTLKRGWWG